MQIHMYYYDWCFYNCHLLMVQWEGPLLDPFFLYFLLSSVYALLTDNTYYLN